MVMLQIMAGSTSCREEPHTWRLRRGRGGPGGGVSRCLLKASLWGTNLQTLKGHLRQEDQELEPGLQSEFKASVRCYLLQPLKIHVSYCISASIFLARTEKWNCVLKDVCVCCLDVARLLNTQTFASCTAVGRMPALRVLCLRVMLAPLTFASSTEASVQLFCA